MKSLVVNYNVLCDKINKQNMLVLSDLHDFPGKRKNDLVDTIINNSPDIVFIAGDIMQAQKYIKGSLSQKNLKDFLRSISEFSPVVLGLGNHDLYNANNDTLLGYKELENSNPGKVFPLNNESIVLNGNRITEFHPSHDAFAPSMQENGGAALQFKEDYEESGIEIPNDELGNILLCHNPKNFVQAYSVGEQLNYEINQDDSNKLMELSKKMKSYDMVISGHMHNGYIPLSKTLNNPSKYIDKGYWEMPIEKNPDGHIKFVRPWIFKKTDLCRGTVYISESGIQIIQLCDDTYYFRQGRDSLPLEVSKRYAMDYIKNHKMIPIVINGGINKYFGLPIDHPEITQVKILKR